jgi:hypothetical protein
MTLPPWRKLTMLGQSLISIMILGLIIARAVNVLASRVGWGSRR